MKMNAMDVRKPSPKMWMPNMLLYIGCSNGAVNIIAGGRDPCLNQCAAASFRFTSHTRSLAAGSFYELLDCNVQSMHEIWPTVLAQGCRMYVPC